MDAANNSVLTESPFVRATCSVGQLRRSFEMRSAMNQLESGVNRSKASDRIVKSSVTSSASHDSNVNGKRPQIRAEMFKGTNRSKESKQFKIDGWSESKVAAVVSIEGKAEEEVKEEGKHRILNANTWTVTSKPIDLIDKQLTSDVTRSIHSNFENTPISSSTASSSSPSVSTGANNVGLTSSPATTLTTLIKSTTNSSCCLTTHTQTPLAPKFFGKPGNDRTTSLRIPSFSTSTTATTNTSTSRVLSSVGDASPLATVRLPGNEDEPFGKQPCGTLLERPNRATTSTKRSSIERNSLNRRTDCLSSSPSTASSTSSFHPPNNDSESFAFSSGCPTSNQVLQELIVQSAEKPQSDGNLSQAPDSNRRRAILIRQQGLRANSRGSSGRNPSNDSSIDAANANDLQLHSNLISLLRNKSLDSSELDHYHQHHIHEKSNQNHPSVALVQKPKFLRSQSDLCARSVQQSGLVVYRRFGAVRQTRAVSSSASSASNQHLQSSSLITNSNHLSPLSNSTVDSNTLTNPSQSTLSPTKLPDLTCLSIANTPTFQPMNRSSLVVIKVPQFAELATSGTLSSSPPPINRSIDSQIKRRSLGATNTDCSNESQVSNCGGPKLITSSATDQVDTYLVKSQSITINRFVNLCDQSNAPINGAEQTPNSENLLSFSAGRSIRHPSVDKTAEQREQKLNELINQELNGLSSLPTMNTSHSCPPTTRSQSVDPNDRATSLSPPHGIYSPTGSYGLCHEEQLSLSSIERILADSPTPPPPPQRTEPPRSSSSSSLSALPTALSSPLTLSTALTALRPHSSLSPTCPAQRTDTFDLATVNSNVQTEDVQELSQIRGILRQLGQTCRRLHYPISHSIGSKDSEDDHSLRQEQKQPDKKKRLRGPYGQLLEQEMRKYSLRDAASAVFGRDAVGGSDGQLRSLISPRAPDEAHMSISANAGLAGSLPENCGATTANQMPIIEHAESSVKVGPARLGSNSCQSSFSVADRLPTQSARDLTTGNSSVADSSRRISKNRLVQLCSFDAQLKRSASFGETGCSTDLLLDSSQANSPNRSVADRVNGLTVQKSLDLGNSDSFDAFGHRRTLSAKRNLVSFYQFFFLNLYLFFCY